VAAHRMCRQASPPVAHAALAIARCVRASVPQLKRRRIPEIEFAQVEGRDTDWMIVDAGNLVVHFFMPAERAYYDLESLWTSMDPDEWLPKPTPEGGAAPSAQQ